MEEKQAICSNRQNPVKWRTKGSFTPIATRSNVRLLVLQLGPQLGWDPFFIFKFIDFEKNSNSLTSPSLKSNSLTFENPHSKFIFNL